MDAGSDQHHTDPLPSLSAQDADAVDALMARRSSQEDANSAGETEPERVEAVGGIFDLVESYPAQAPSDDLVARTMQRIEESRRPLKLAEAAPSSFGSRISAISFRLPELAAVAAMITIGICLSLVILNRHRSDARRFACEANLALTAASFGQYAADYNDLLPRQQVRPGMAWYQVGQTSETGEAVNSNSANLYLLARNRYVNPATMSCPENASAPNVMHAHMYDWPKYEAVSYSYQNQYTAQAQRLSQSNRIAVLADKNPMFQRVNSQLAYRKDIDPDSASFAHGGYGQNIVLADGSVVWSVRPIVNGDNIWLANGIDQYDGTESPVGLTDTFLVP